MAKGKAPVACPAQAGLKHPANIKISGQNSLGPVNKWLSVSRQHYETFHEMAEFYRMALWRRDCHVASNTHRLGYLSAEYRSMGTKRLAIRVELVLALIGVAVVAGHCFSLDCFFARVASRKISDRITDSKMPLLNEK